MAHDFHTLTISEVVQEISGAATSVTFDVPPALRDVFTWQAGQHLTVRFTLEGEEQRRSYTISNPPGTPLRITVKRVSKGVVSNHVGDNLAVGDQIEVMPPFGGFTLVPADTARRTHWFFGAGSGITPLFAMINSVLSDEPYSVAHLVYGNADADSILFKDTLEALEEAYPNRFTLRHVISTPSIWSWFTPWRKGRVDADAIEAAMSETPPVAQDVQYWVCGPGSMNGDVKAALMALDAPSNRIHMESFGGDNAQDTSVKGVASTATVALDGVAHQVPVAAEQTLLQAMRTVGVNPPFSCQSGVCGACKAKLSDGEVHMRVRIALEDQEVANGDVLTCQSVALSDQLAIRFER